MRQVVLKIGSCLLVLAVAACGGNGTPGQQGPEGAPGSVGPQGPQGPQGPPGMGGGGGGGGGGVGWGDATGAAVPGAVGLPMKYFDGDGNVWDVDPFSGAIAPPPLPVQQNVRWFYLLSNCTGTRYLENVNYQATPRPIWLGPRVPFLDPDGHGYRVINDTAALMTVPMICGIGSGGGCQPLPAPCTTITGFPETSTHVVPLPAVPGVPPFHPLAPE